MQPPQTSPFERVRDDLDALLRQIPEISGAAAETGAIVLIDATAQAIEQAIGALPPACAEHLAKATRAARARELPTVAH